MKQIKEVKDSHRWSGVGGVSGGPTTGPGSSGVGLHGVSGLHGHVGIHGGGGIHGSDKISQKDAKTIFEHAQKLEAEYKHLISGINIVCNFLIGIRKQYSYFWCCTFIKIGIFASTIKFHFISRCNSRRS